LYQHQHQHLLLVVPWLPIATITAAIIMRRWKVKEEKEGWVVVGVVVVVVVVMKCWWQRRGRVTILMSFDLNPPMRASTSR